MMSTTSRDAETASRPGVVSAPRILVPGLLIGIGLGGFVDGILLHQILQWHHMLTNTPDDTIGLDRYPATTVDGLEANTLVDGFFHAFTWFAVVVGLVMLWRIVVNGRGPWSRRSLLGAVLAGWGVFNLVEGVVDHHLLQIHHVRMASDVDNVLAWDLGFLALGAVLLVAGLALYRRSTAPIPER
jgi:uncharacterized membrane protein